MLRGLKGLRKKGAAGEIRPRDLQGLKPDFDLIVFGTTEVMPFHKALVFGTTEVMPFHKALVIGTTEVMPFHKALELSARRKSCPFTSTNLRPIQGIHK